MSLFRSPRYQARVMNLHEVATGLEMVRYKIQDRFEEHRKFRIKTKNNLRLIRNEITNHLEDFYEQPLNLDRKTLKYWRTLINEILDD